jgi:hypothetical protein
LASSSVLLCWVLICSAAAWSALLGADLFCYCSVLICIALLGDLLCSCLVLLPFLELSFPPWLATFAPLALSSNLSMILLSWS